MTVSVAALGERALRRLGVAIVPVADRPALSTLMLPSTLASNALVELGVIASDETPSASDQALALARVLSVHEAMVAQGFVPWSINAIPQAVSEEYSRIAGLQLASAFGKQGDPQMVTVLEQRVRKVAMVLQAPDEAAQAVFDVHQNLSARGLVRWSVFDMPDAAELPYVMLAANRLAPSFGAQADPNDDVAATRALYQIIALPSSGEATPVAYF
ncbi:MAG TPA: hypothetical protein VGI78_02315 [Acetobacteraceae bacterium]|jgi:hypothetical protein